MKAIHNNELKLMKILRAVVNIVKSKNESNSQHSKGVYRSRACCCKYR